MNLNITKSEFKLLKKFYKADFLIVDNQTSKLLQLKKLIEPQSSHVNRDGSVVYSNELTINNNGRIAYENYHNNKLSVRRANIQSWIAIAISAGSFILSLISLLSEL